MNQQKNPNSPNRLLTLLHRASLPVLAALGFMASATLADAQSYTLSNSFLITNSTPGTHVTAAGDVNRGMAYSAISNQVFICNKGITGSGTPGAIDVFDGSTGAYIASVNTNGLAGGTFLLDQIGVADDGVLYGINLSTAIGSTAFKIYRWADWNNPPDVAFSGTLAPPSGTRMGDNIAVTGAGTNTIVLVPIQTSGPTTNFALFGTTDGTHFSATIAGVSGLPSVGTPNGPQFGVTFYTNNTFLFKPGTPSTSIFLIQFPANFVGTPSVTATVLATNTFNGIDVLIYYNPAAQLLASIGPIPSSTVSTTVTPLTLYSMPTFSSINNVASTTFSTIVANGNFVGQVAFGGAGKTNFIYGLDCNNGMLAAAIGFTPAPQKPTITTQPLGTTTYANGSYTLTVAATGTPPLHYLWQYNTVSNLATAANILNAPDAASYTITNLTTNASGWYDVVVSNGGGSTSSVPVLVSVTAPLSNPSVTQIWSLAADNSQPYLDTSYNTRGLAFDPATMTVVVAEHNSASIYALNASNGNYMYTLTTPSTGLPSGSIFPLGQVGISDDGVLYSCNVSSYQPGQQTGGGVPFSITRFSAISDPNGSNAYTLDEAFTGDPGDFLTGTSGGTYSGGDRWGDSFAIRGSGTDTQILLGSYQLISGNQFGTGPGTNVSILTTTDGAHFTPTTIVVTDPTQSSNTPPSGFAYLGVAWGASNTFWTKSPGFNLRQIRYDLAAGTGVVIQSFATTAGQGSLNNLDGIGLDNANNILAGVITSDRPNDLELFQIPSAGFPPQPYYQAFFAAYNANINGNAATTIKFPYIFSLNANNGIIGLKYSIPLLQFPIEAVKSGNKIVLTWPTVTGHTYQLQTASPLIAASNSWLNVGAPVTTSAPGSLSYTNTIPTTENRVYRVFVQ